MKQRFLIKSKLVDDLKLSYSINDAYTATIHVLQGGEQLDVKATVFSPSIISEIEKARLSASPPPPQIKSPGSNNKKHRDNNSS